LIVANFVVFIILGAIAAVYNMGIFPGIYAVSISYGVAFEVWASVSLATDTAIAGIMIWSVCEI
jgi:hypothetical protein